MLLLHIIKTLFKGAWLAPSIDRATLDLRSVSPSPNLGVEPT